ncbi:hypothetical protein CEE69_14085 [Rhodopirellula bahusiensis]|uniref:Uncharacterized protein n=1 Tax=Rhodopirellula bahusiensis TaxID=2014065 RepID=A0A2G1W693_9BACT|nr:hypothetical protein CEE69_14085 [Rhodopirellula bahusiensis]
MGVLAVRLVSETVPGGSGTTGVPTSESWEFQYLVGALTLLKTPNLARFAAWNDCSIQILPSSVNFLQAEGMAFRLARKMMQHGIVVLE